jgi:hypothetical protein
MTKLLLALIIGFIAGIAITELCRDDARDGEGQGRPMPSIEYVQTLLNDHGEGLVVDGVAGTKTVAAWAYWSPTWQNMNEKEMTK